MAPGPVIPLDAAMASNVSITLPPDLRGFVRSDAFVKELRRRGIQLPSNLSMGFDANALAHTNGSHPDIGLELLGGRTSGLFPATFDFYIGGVFLAHVPEPSTIALLLASGLMLVLVARRRQ